MTISGSCYLFTLSKHLLAIDGLKSPARILLSLVHLA